MPYPEIDPVLLALGPLKIHWYGVMYLMGFLAAWWLGMRRSHLPHSPVKPEQIEDFLLYCAFGVVIGGRLASVLFYNLETFLENPLWLFKVWEGGMSFHGGFLGVLFATWLFARRIGSTFWHLTDFIAPFIPPGLGFGRIGNFINQELPGRVTEVPWGLVYPRDPLGLVRHPSALYQCFLEGVVMFVILYWYSRKPRPLMAVSGVFLLLYGSFRCFTEFFREPDSHIGFDLFGWVTRGQILSLPMVLGGCLLLWQASRKGDKPAGTGQ